MYRSTYFHRWGPACLGTLLLAACPIDGDVASDSDPGVSSGEPSSSGSPPTGDAPTGDSPTGDSPTTNSPTTDAPTTDSPTTDSPTTDSPTTDSPTTDSPTTGAATTDPVGSSTGVTGPDSSSGTSGDGSSTSGDGSSTSGGVDGSTGEPVQSGSSVSQTVNAGKTASSPNFRMVFTFGQPTQHQGTHTSKNFRLQGGLSGANGEIP